MIPSSLAPLEVSLGRVAFLQFIDLSDIRLSISSPHASAKVPIQISRARITGFGWFAWEKVVLTPKSNSCFLDALQTLPSVEILPGQKRRGDVK